MATLGGSNETRFTRADTSESEEATPQLGGTARGKEVPPKGPPSPPFIMAIHPQRWTVVGGQVVPNEARVLLMQGVNNVDVDANGRPQAGVTLAQYEEQGWQIIPWDIEGKGKSYMKRVKSTGGWTTKWETLHPGSEDVTADEVGLAKFWQRLIKAKKIDAPARHVLDNLRRSIVKAVESEIRKIAGKEETARLGQLRDQLKVVDLALEAMPRSATVAETEEDTPDASIS